MRVTIAGSGDQQFIGNMYESLEWARTVIESGPAETVRILRDRPGAGKPKALFHIDVDGIRPAKGAERRRG